MQDIQINKLTIAISNVLNTWEVLISTQDKIPNNIIALNFGLQHVNDGYEMYLEGFEWFDRVHESWLLDNIWSPNADFISLGKEFLGIPILQVLNVYKETLTEHLQSSKIRLPTQVQAVTLCLANGKPFWLL